MIIVGITGKAGSGKDTVADRLVDKHGFKKMSFAAPLKAVLYTMNPIIGFDLYQPQRQLSLREGLEKYGEESIKKLYPEYRKLLQRLGTEGIRSFDEEFWVKCAAKEIKAEPNDARLVFTDTRFPNEAKAIQQAGWYKSYILSLPGATTELWTIHREAERKGEVVAPHASEDHVGNMGEEREIDNNYELETLYDYVDDLAYDLIDVEQVKLAG